MESVVRQHLDSDIFVNNVSYFFTSLVNRFDYSNQMLVQALEKRFGQTFKPIYLYSSDPGPDYVRDNFLVVNKGLSKYQKMLGTEKVVSGQEYEDLNIEVSQSKTIKTILEKLSLKQERIFYASFTSSFLTLSHPKLVIVGPREDIATRYDSKLAQYKLFRKLKLPVINFREYTDTQQVEENETFPFFLTSLYTSGGGESSMISDKTALDNFYSNLREINKRNQLVVSDYVADITATPNVSAMVINENDVRVIAVTDQILNGNAYLGNIYPSNISLGQQQQVKEIAATIGRFLGSIGYRGFFGCDFIINSQGEVFVNDLNPRRQGGYMCNLLLSRRINLIEEELLLALGESASDFNEADFQVDFAWAHSKIKVHYGSDEKSKFKKLKKPVKKSSLTDVFQNIGNEFTTTFYPKGYILTGGFPGYYAISGSSRSEVEKKAELRPDFLLHKMLG